MKRSIVLALAAILTSGALMAQQPEVKQAQRPVQQRSEGHCGNCPHHAKHQPQDSTKQHPHHGKHGNRPQRNTELQYNADGLELTLINAFPYAKSVKKTSKWTEVYDANDLLLGYALYSKPASNGIKGYNGETPVMIAFSKKKVILGVYALPNAETPRFAKRVEDAGFYKNWNGLSIRKAKKKQVDAVSGATFTSKAVARSVKAALETL